VHQTGGEQKAVEEMYLPTIGTYRQSMPLLGWVGLCCAFVETSWLIKELIRVERPEPTDHHLYASGKSSA
jgi:hypothetical protein